jgi:electron transfer flavoprotein alpha subunit
MVLRFAHQEFSMTRQTYSDEPRDIWVVAETKDGALTPLTKELVYGARTAADMMGFYVKVALLRSGVSNLANELYPVGADRVYVADDNRLAEFAFEPWLKVLSDLFTAQAPEFVLFGATPIGEALAPRLAQRFGAGLITHALMLKVDDFDRCFIGRRAAYGGEYYEVMSTAGARSHFATVLPDTFGAPYPDASRYGEVETVEVNLDDVEVQIKTIGPVEFVPPQPKLKAAKQIVSIGRQIGDIVAAKALAETLGAELAGACEALDENYIGESQVVGITGEQVTPNLYIALGIRGDTMHTWGMKGARYVVAVHPDPDAPILKQADAAIVGDPAKIAKELAEALSKN